MGWFRLNRCSVAWLALFALACQFVLAFGHVHGGKTAAGLDSSTIAAAIGNSTEIGSSPADATSPAPPKKPAGLADVICAVCASISMASALVSMSPAVVTPVSASQHLRWSSAAIDPQSFDHLLFDARGPPLA